MTNSHTYTNKLIEETSPYLLQHAHNPVDWHPWGDEAIQKAKIDNKIILVSIGYSACHWCHVMERESFEDEATAFIMNEHFINIKIDREERPDLDHIYMDAIQAITGSGGWPLNVFLTPDKKPFYGGTYFPPENAFNRSSWKEVLLGVAKAWQERSHEIISQAENLTDHINKAGSFSYNSIKMEGISQEDIFSWDVIESMYEGIMKTADTQWGGFGKAPKFPQTFTIGFLLKYFHYSKDTKALDHALLSINKMLEGGIYDHIAGGLARYSTDNEWLAPHFEKMLYDNALLLDILCDAYQITKNDLYEKAIIKTINFVKQELLDTNGGFYAALDADSEGVEGKYYIWNKIEIESLLGENAAIFCEYFDVSANGNWENENILRILKPLAVFAKEKNLDLLSFEKTIINCLEILEKVREKRVKPGLDDKLILGWNALMLKSFGKAAIVLKNNDFLTMAIANCAFIFNKLQADTKDGAMRHTWKHGEAKYPAFLDDYAYLIDACIQMYQATFNIDYLEKARLSCKYVCDHFSDEEKVFFYYTHQLQKDIIVRKKEMYDGAIPSGNALMASNLQFLSIAYDEPNWRLRAIKMLQAVLPAASKYSGSFGVWASLILRQTKGLNEITITGKGASAVASDIQWKYFIADKFIFAAEKQLSGFSVLSGKTFESSPFIYLCKNNICSAPLNEEDFLKKNAIFK